MLRADTECFFYEDGIYSMLLWTQTNENQKLLMKEVDHCFRILRFLGAPPGFCVNWWRIPIKRVVQPDVFPTRAEVNGGWARHNIPEVFIFRLEEWDRVLIHECIHAFDWDVIPDSNVKSCLNRSIGGELTQALFEAATELNAEWLWCIIHSPANDFSGETWLKQIEWQQKQAFSILARRQDVWIEDTSIFAYYVLKAILALNMTDFLISWLSGRVDTHTWCEQWSKYKQTFLQQAELYKNTKHIALIMRMTNPSLENFNYL